MLALAAVCCSGLLVGCNSGGNVVDAGSTLGTAPVPPAPTPATLAVVKPVIDCTQLAAVDVSDIGGVGSKITSATVTTEVQDAAPLAVKV
jgi:feruloyl esterase